MKPTYLIICIVLLISGCKNEHTPRDISNFVITEYPIDSVSIRAIYAKNQDKVFFAGSNGKIGFTNNAGKTWKKQIIKFKDSITPSFRSIAFNRNEIFVLSVGNPALLYRISDLKTDLVYEEHHKKVFYDSMKFFDDGLTGIAVGDPTENCPSIIMTHDGGNSWKKLPSTTLPNFQNGEAFFAASNTNIKIINNTVWIASGGKKARILKSKDKGKTWEIFKTPIVQGNGPQGIYSIDFIDENNGIIVGGDYSKPDDNCENKAITNDGGQTWKIISNNEAPNYKSCVRYVPNTEGKEIIAVGKTGISFSSNAGKTWKNISKKGYYAIQWIDKNNAWLSGNNKLAKLMIP